MTQPAANSLLPAVILAGGRSSRMGEPKALLPFGPARLVDHVAARIRPQAGPIAVNSNDPAIALPGTASFPDRFVGFAGPLAGIHAALSHVADAYPGATHTLIAPTDGPFFPKDLVARLSETIKGPDDIALASSLGRVHPVLGLWPVTAIPRLAGWLENPPTLKVRAFLDGLSVRITEFPVIETPLGPLDPFFNINTHDDLDLARKMLEVVGN